ncbi:MAG TPA: carbohydrate ABC transporter permease [Chloroflexia bacterium]|jgi:multiple sugar transport system permease protein
MLYDPAERQRHILHGGTRRTSVLRLVVAVVLAAIFVIPLIWMVSTSLRPIGIPPATQFEWLPPALSFENYVEVFRVVEMGRFLRNSLLVMLTAVPITLVTASLGGFAISQLPGRAQGIIVAVSVASLLVPKMVLWISLFLIYKWIGIINTPIVLVVPALMGTSPLFVLMFAWAFRRIPREYFEQARLDGAGPWRIWRSIALPLARPIAIAVVILSTEFYWSDFTSPLFYISNQEYYTVPMGVLSLRQMDLTNWPLFMSGSVVLTLPVLITFIIAQRHFFHEERGRGWLGL